MQQETAVIAGAGLAETGRASRWPARLDLAQSLSGLVLGLFMWGHMLFVSSILLGNDAMWAVARAFEGYFLFGRPYPAIVSGVVAAVMLLLAVHAALALRKFPASYRELRTMRDHLRVLRHPDTTLWLWQVATGFVLLLLAFVHLYLLFVSPDRIGPYESADRVWSDHLWPLYLVLLFAVEIHGTVGLYRLCLKWGWFLGTNPTVARRRLKALKWGITVFFLALGLASLAAYIRIGIEHADDYGEPYRPAWVSERE
jgi:fumarate reductase subunit C